MAETRITKIEAVGDGSIIATDELGRKTKYPLGTGRYLPLAGGTMTGAIAMGTNKITGLGDPTAAQDAATRAYVLAQSGLYLPLAGGTMAGDITLGAHGIRTTSVLIKETPGLTIRLRNLSDDAYVDLQLLNLLFAGYLRASSDATFLYACNVNDNYLSMAARDTNVGYGTVLRLVGAATAYAEATRGIVLLPMTDPANIIEGWLFYDSADDKLRYRDAAATRLIAVEGLTKLDDLATPDDNTDLDAAAAKHGLMSKIDKVKLDGSVSTANKSIYVDKEATGAADGTSYTDAYTTIQAAVDSMEDVIIHAYTIYARDGTKKTGTADENTASHLVDDASSQFVAADVGKRVFNVTDGTWGVVTAYNDAGDLTLEADTFPDGDEDYVLEATPYRETIHLNDDPATYPSHLILGSLVIEAEYSWYGAACDAQANAGEILDASVDFTGVEVGDRVWVLDRTGASDTAQDYEYGTVDDISQIASHIVRTTLTKTPTTEWYYAITKTELSGSDDGTDGGTARGYIFQGKNINKVTVNGFYLTFSDSYAVRIDSCLSWVLNGCIFDSCDYGTLIQDYSLMNTYYNLWEGTTIAMVVPVHSKATVDHFAAEGTSACIYAYRKSWVQIAKGYLHNSAKGLWLKDNSSAHITQGTIHTDVTAGITASTNASVEEHGSVANNATTPYSPVGTSEGAFIL